MLPELTLSLQFGKFKDVDKHRAALPRHAVTRAIRHALVDDAEITVRIVGEDEGRELNKSYRKKDYATNVLTFAYDEGEDMPLPEGLPLMGDLVLCRQVVEREAAEQGKTLAAHYAHLLVHGTLHAQGWDHETSEADAEEMARRLAREEGIFAGISAAGACWVALELAKTVENATIVFVVCDRGDRYLSTGVFPA